MRIEELHLRKIGPFESLDLKFPCGADSSKADTVLLVGPNGSGKSTILYAIAGSLTNEPLPAISDRFRGLESVADGLSIVDGEKHRFGCWPPSGIGIPDSGFGSSGNASRTVLWGPLLQASQGRQVSAGETISDDARLAFGYAATRTLAAQTQQISPVHHEALFGRFDFDRPLAFELFSKWVNDVLALRDAATIEGELESAAKVAGGIGKLESFISQVVGSTTTFARDLSSGDIVLKSSDGERIPILALPEGLKSILSWLGDLLRRLYRIPTPGDLSPADLPFLLLLDEIDVHLHPKWQRLVIPAVETLFPNAQIILSTHSPFVVCSADDAYVVWLNEDGSVREDIESSSRRGWSYGAILELMGIGAEFDVGTTDRLHELDALAVLVRTGEKSLTDFESAAEDLPKTEELQFVVDDQLRQLRRYVERNGIVSV